MVVGNKTDLVEEDSERAVQSKDGKKLAEVHCNLQYSDLPHYYRVQTAVMPRLYLSNSE